MTKTELKEILRYYAQISKSTEVDKAQVVIKRYRSEIHIDSEWVKGVNCGINELLKSESEIVRKIIEFSYIKGYKDRKVVMHLPISDSSFYRLKKDIEEKIYELCIIYGCVTEDDILKSII